MGHARVPHRDDDQGKAHLVREGPQGEYIGQAASWCRIVPTAKASVRFTGAVPTSMTAANHVAFMSKVCG